MLSPDPNFPINVSWEFGGTEDTYVPEDDLISAGTGSSETGNKLEISDIEVLMSSYGQTYNISSGVLVAGGNDDLFYDTIDDYNDAWDRNGDGILSFIESYTWYKYGNGAPIDIDGSTVRYLSYNTYAIGFGEDYLVHGQMTLNKNMNGHIHYGMYDFEQHPGDGFWLMLRNYATELGKAVHGDGTPFEIRYHYKNNSK